VRNVPPGSASNAVEVDLLDIGPDGPGIRAYLAVRGVDYCTRAWLRALRSGEVYDIQTDRSVGTTGSAALDRALADLVTREIRRARARRRLLFGEAPR
jgi:hypothetical protein